MPEQLPLFAPSETPKPVDTVSPTDDVRAAAEGLPEGLHLGTCSWSFPGWNGIVYDREASKTVLARHGLAAYAGHPLLGAVCLDRTYYGPISAEAFRSYAAQVPSGFRFIVKAHELLTRGDSPHYLDPSYAEAEVIGPCLEGLGEKVAAILLQFPPQAAGKLGGPERFAEELQRFLTALPKAASTFYAVELRTHALLTPSYVAAISAAEAAHAYNVHPTMPGIAEQARLAEASRFPAVVVRWMLHRSQSYESAVESFQPFDRLVARDEDSRGAIAALCRGAAGRGQRAFVVVNNKAEGSAPLSLLSLARAVGG